MRKAFKYRLWTNRNQERELDIMLETHRRLYNVCLAQRKSAFESEGKSIKYTDQSAWFKEERKTNEYFARVNFSSAQATMRRLDKAYQNFFRRVKNGEKPGYPRFKSRDHFNSIEFPSHGDGIRLSGSKLRVQHVGLIRVNLHRPVEGAIKTLSLKKEAGKWHLVASCDLGELPAAVNDLPAVGMDMGIEFFLTTSDGEHIPNPNFLQIELPELRRAQRALSRKKKGGKNRKKAVKRVQKLHAGVRNKRNEFHHKVVNDLLRCYGTIAVESLRVSNMLGNHGLARAISDVAWATFVSILRYKAESAGAIVMDVAPQYTSQECSGCGQRVPKKLSVRIHHCPFCDLRIHRDINAARNILKRALQARTEPAGLNPEDARGVLRSRLLEPAEWSQSDLSQGGFSQRSPGALPLQPGVYHRKSGFAKCRFRGETALLYAISVPYLPGPTSRCPPFVRLFRGTPRFS